MEKNSFIPDVFVIGAMKSGTSTFYRNLVKNGKLNFTNQKEPNVFCGYDKKLEEVEKKYRNIFENNIYPKIDVSPAYSRKHQFGNVAREIYKFNPEAKIIYLVRDPIERLISHAKHDILRDRIRGNVYNTIITNPDYILTSSYFYQIQPYVTLFGINNILVYQFEKLIEDEFAFQKKLKEFIQTDVRLRKFKPFNISERRYVIKFHDYIHRFVSSPKVLKAYHIFWFLLNLKPPKFEFGEKELKFIYLQLKKDIDQFNQLFDIDLSQWKTFSQYKNY